MQFMSIRELRLHTPHVMESVRKGKKVVITNHGKPQAVLLHLTEDEIEDIAFRQPAFLKEIEQARKEYRRKGGISLARARKRLGL